MDGAHLRIAYKRKRRKENQSKAKNTCRMGIKSSINISFVKPCIICRLNCLMCGVVLWHIATGLALISRIVLAAAAAVVVAVATTTTTTTIPLYHHYHVASPLTTTTRLHIITPSLQHYKYDGVLQHSSLSSTVLHSTSPQCVENALCDNTLTLTTFARRQ